MFQYYDVSADTSHDVGGVRLYARRGIMLHTTEGTDSLPWLQGGSAKAGSSASSDFLIGRRGDIYQVSSVGRFAYHSGKALYKWITDRDGTLNQSFVGIEMESSKKLNQVVTDEQYIACAALVARLTWQHDIDLRLCCGHYEAALPSGRKSDPSGFYWAEWWNELLHPSKEAINIAFPVVLP